MKKLFKIVTINDGEKVTLHNGDRFYIETPERANRIVEGLLNNGWELKNISQHLTPSIQKEGSYSFYLGGWDFFFEKNESGNETDDADTIIENIIQDIVTEREIHF